MRRDKAIVKYFMTHDTWVGANVWLSFRARCHSAFIIHIMRERTLRARKSCAA